MITTLLLPGYKQKLTHVLVAQFTKFPRGVLYFDVNPIPLTVLEGDNNSFGKEKQFVSLNVFLSAGFPPLK